MFSFSTFVSFSLRTYFFSIQSLVLFVHQTTTGKRKTPNETKEPSKKKTTRAKKGERQVEDEEEAE